MEIKLLLADDHRLMREAVKLMLDQDRTLRVVGQAGDGKEAVELATLLQPDVVVMDVTMPILNGIEATRQIKTLAPQVKVIIVTMHSERQFISEAVAAGASGYVLKDGPAPELLDAIKAVAGGTSFFSARVQEVLLAPCRGRVPLETPMASLSPREREVLQLTAEGKNTKEIALLLFLSSKTIEGHRRQLMTKLNINNVADLTRYAIREGIASLT